MQQFEFLYQHPAGSLQNPQVLPVLQDREELAQLEIFPPLVTGAAKADIFFFTALRLHSGQTGPSVLSTLRTSSSKLGVRILASATANTRQTLTASSIDPNSVEQC